MRKRQIERVKEKGIIEQHWVERVSSTPSTQMATKRKYIKMNSNIKCSSCYGGFLKLFF